jgi:hypothetical protein
MQPQTPAKGIMLSHDYGNSKFYKVSCDCGSPDHDINFEVEADEYNVMVNSWIKHCTVWQHLPLDCTLLSINNPFHGIEYNIRHFFFSLWSRIKLTYSIWVKGYLEYEASVLMDEQQATNYATAMLNAVVDVQEFKKK